MRILEGNTIYSASDLVAFASCKHRTTLEYAYISNILGIKPEVAQGMAQIAGVRGTEHERKVLAQLNAQHNDLVNLSDLAHATITDLRVAALKTLEAMKSGASLIYQGVFFHGNFCGYPDFLRKTIATNGETTYEVLDAKLKRSLSSDAVIQLTAYSLQVEKLGFPLPTQLVVYLGNDTQESFAVLDAAPFVRKVTNELEQVLAQPAVVPKPIWAPKIGACEMCPWKSNCEDGRKQARDLSLVAKMRDEQRSRLMKSGITTIDSLAEAPDEKKPPFISKDTFARLRDQARLQLLQEKDSIVRHEVFSSAGLRLLPSASPGDVWFDMEGSPFAEPPFGIDYLFGAITFDTDVEVFTDFWAHTPSEEKKAFESFVDWVELRRLKWPDLHVYHYANYEKHHLGHLSSRFATREAIIDDWLRNNVLFDLLTVVNRSIRISQDSYSIKKFEPLYNFIRDQTVQSAEASVVDYEKYIHLFLQKNFAGAQECLDQIKSYNEADCKSTRAIDLWLRQQAQGQDLSPNLPVPVRDATVEQEDVRLLREQMESMLPSEKALRTPDQDTLALLAAGLNFHRREVKPQWWEYFQRIESDIESLEQTDKVAKVSNAVSSNWLPPTGLEKKFRRNLKLTYEGGEALDLLENSTATLLYESDPTVVDLNSQSKRSCSRAVVNSNSKNYLTLTEVQSSTGNQSLQLPIAIIQESPPCQNAIALGMKDAAQLCANNYPDFPHLPAFDVLRRQFPDQGGVNLHSSGETQRDVVNTLRTMKSSYIAIQGPPGTGKSYLTARVIKELVETGWRVAVVGPSHKVVENVLKKTIEAGLSGKVVAKESKNPKGVTWINPSKLEKWLPLQTGGVLAGGTAWTFRRKAIVNGQPFDLLVIDEAGQFSLGNMISVSLIAKRLLLVGDQQQLPQVSNGLHPEPINVSALSWLLNGASVISPKFGYFLNQSYRMAPQLCEIVSQFSYQGQLKSHPISQTRRLAGVDSGVHIEIVNHQDRTTSSIEEARRVVDIIKSLLGRDWTDEHGVRPLTESDILVVAPFNAQKNTIYKQLVKEGLSEVAVGTVDKFQGQEAPIAIMSMTASSVEQIARGWEFLFNRNRLNVAISRAQWASYLLYSPNLLRVPISKPEHLAVVSGLLSLVEPRSR